MVLWTIAKISFENYYYYYFRSNFYHNFQVNTCPIDRGVFQFIIVYNRIGGHEIAREKIKQKVAEDTPAEGNICRFGTQTKSRNFKVSTQLYT